MQPGRPQARLRRRLPAPATAAHPPAKRKAPPRTPHPAHAPRSPPSAPASRCPLPPRRTQRGACLQQHTTARGRARRVLPAPPARSKGRVSLAGQGAALQPPSPPANTHVAGCWPAAPPCCCWAAAGGTGQGLPGGWVVGWPLGAAAGCAAAAGGSAGLSGCRRAPLCNPWEVWRSWRWVDRSTPLLFCGTVCAPVRLPTVLTRQAAGTSHRRAPPAVRAQQAAAPAATEPSSAAEPPHPGNCRCQLAHRLVTGRDHTSLQVQHVPGRRRRAAVQAAVAARHSNRRTAPGRPVLLAMYTAPLSATTTHDPLHRKVFA